jgi:mono/diheme cytochrome c family protein
MEAGVDHGGLRSAGGIEVRAALLFLIPAIAWTQNLQDVLKQGEVTFATTCATGYCHGPKGTPAGAPRLAARGFDQAYINNVVSRGVPGTAMPGFNGTLSRQELIAVVAYVATLNGIANPSLTPPGRGRGPGGPSTAAPAGPPLTGEAAEGRQLFMDAVRGFGRCSTCHEQDGIGIAVATPISKVPADVAALRALASPDVSTAILGGESFPVLLLARKSQSVTFYDLSVPPPVLRIVEPGAVKIAEGSTWKHSAVIGAYNDAELGAILAYLKAVVKP